MELLRNTRKTKGASETHERTAYKVEKVVKQIDTTNDENTLYAGRVSFLQMVFWNQGRIFQSAIPMLTVVLSSGKNPNSFIQLNYCLQRYRVVRKKIINVEARAYREWRAYIWQTPQLQKLSSMSCFCLQKMCFRLSWQQKGSTLYNRNLFVLATEKVCTKASWQYLKTRKTWSSISRRHSKFFVSRSFTLQSSSRYCSEWISSAKDATLPLISSLLDSLLLGNKSRFSSTKYPGDFNQEPNVHKWW